MRRLQIARDIVPIGEFKSHAAQLLRQMRSSRRPLVITQNGKPAAVVMTPAEFDRLCEERQFVGAVRQGLADVEAGRTITDAALERQLDAEFGPLE